MDQSDNEYKYWECYYERLSKTDCNIYLVRILYMILYLVFRMQNNKKQYKSIPLNVSIHVRYLYQDQKVTVSELTSKLITDTKVDGRVNNSGRPKKISQRDGGLILRNLEHLTEKIGTFTSADLLRETGLKGISTRTIRRFLNKNNYGYYQCRRKGQLLKKTSLQD